MKIGELAERTGTSVPTIRYYEEVGLLRRPDRQSGQRVYGRDDVEQLRFVRRCREFDFSIDQVRTLVAVMRDSSSSCMTARDIAAEQLDAIRLKMKELKALERSLVNFVADCDRRCEGGSGPDCVVLAEFSRPTSRTRGSRARR